ncbi:hypothetical protein [Pedobacter roseus]|uniref:DUF5045 domain-containing protein n=1 Tax=Pedobacter roseus TaxID=336820 RepID=A0A7G9QI17_9SPHI|nr:hypothetical protein [Pedobacter roseus]QNN42992.1 hypothetical protein H9L23_02480 [Pedobacter roseus]
MKKLILMLLMGLRVLCCPAQRIVSDEHIKNQQERMVFKQWDRDKFTPKPGFLGLNPYYWLTWALHPNYPGSDLRPLGPQGPQTQRIALALAMSQADQAYQLHSDTLKAQALMKASAFSGLLSDMDPLWQLYYRYAFAPLLSTPENELEGAGAKARAYLISSGLYSWFAEERESLLERLQTARKTTLSRGERLLSYQRMLGEYHKLEAVWEEKKRLAWKHISISDAAGILHKSGPKLSPASRRDIAIADEILKHSKL